jgi:xanthine dehydrogenase accessory factor
MNDPVGNDAVIEALLSARRQRQPAVLVTVIGVKGSTPRKPGAKMLVLAQGRLVGTIGGGALEHTLVEQAVSLFGRDEPVLVERHLTHELGMCCGGSVTVLLEPQSYAPRLYLFGAGHVSAPVAQVASLAGFDVTVIDERDDLATAERFPTVQQRLVEPPLDVVDDLPMDADHTYVVVITHDHSLDEAIAARLLRRPWRYFGIIGSARKREMFKKRLGASGFEPELLDRMRTPVGLEIEAETPGEIAVSIVAELVAVRRGAALGAQAAPATDSGGVAVAR